MTKVSVIVPVYNTEKYLRRCLDSLVNQTLEDVEIIIINDCSPDNSKKIIEEYYKKYKSKIKVFENKENKRIGYNRNLGIEKATGEYISFIDSDDWVKENILEKMYNKAKKDKLDLVICNYTKMLEEKDGSVKEIPNDYKIPEYENTTLEKTPELLMTVNMSPWNKLYKKSLLEDNNIVFAEKSKYEDMIVVIKSLAKAKKIGFIKDELNYYLVRSKSETTCMDEKVFDILKMTDISVYYLRKQTYYKKIKEYAEAYVVRNLFRYTIQQRYQKDRNIRNKFIDEVFEYLDTNFPNWKSNKIYKKRPFAKRLIETNKLFTKIYCSIVQTFVSL